MAHQKATHLRVCIEPKNGTNLVFQEATLANIARAYTTIKTHPQLRALELELKLVNAKQLKEGCARHQQLETSKTRKEIEEELGNLLKASI